MSAAPIILDHLSHSFGEGEVRRGVLFDVSAEIRRGEIVIVTGPSGSGKTTLLTLIGALRSAQEGSLRVLGSELRGADEGTLARVRRRIGYVFQAHNLLDALTAQQNVQMSLELDAAAPAAELARRSRESLEAVGLGDRIDAHPSELSGGQRQRVAIARALARRPEIVLVTHDSRILDLADRILTLEDGRLASLMHAVSTDARQGLQLLVRDLRRGELASRVEALDAHGFAALLDRLTEETRHLLELVDLVQGEAFDSMLDQVARAFTTKTAQLIEAERATLFLLDEAAGEIWSTHFCEHGRERELRIPLDRGLIGEVSSSGRLLNVPDLARDPRFDATVDARDLPNARRLLAVPVTDSRNRAFAVLALLRSGALPPFDAGDEQRIAGLTSSLAVILESWWRMSCSCRAAGIGRMPPCCDPLRPDARAPAPSTPKTDLRG
jgi:putative ABC transport system ATP-binding protein